MTSTTGSWLAGATNTNQPPIPQLKSPPYEQRLKYIPFPLTSSAKPANTNCVNIN
nr:hypothetical protein [Plesiomonas shigelloides]